MNWPAFTAGLMIGAVLCGGISAIIYIWSDRWERAREERNRQ